MNKSEYECLQNLTKQEPLAKAAELLSNHQPRTLVYGYTLERDTFHVYLAADGVHRVIYDGDKVLIDHKSEASGLQLRECLPSKRAYPERCDFEFARELTKRGLELSFTSWTDDVRPVSFYGFRVVELFSNVKGEDFTLPLTTERTTELFPSLTPENAASLVAFTRFREYWEATLTSYLKERVLRAAEQRDPNRWLVNALQLMPSYFSRYEQDQGPVDTDLIGGLSSLDTAAFVKACEKITEPRIQVLQAKWG